MSKAKHMGRAEGERKEVAILAIGCTTFAPAQPIAPLARRYGSVCTRHFHVRACDDDTSVTACLHQTCNRISPRTILWYVDHRLGEHSRELVVHCNESR
jgi:hypothetical protein